MGGQTVEDSWRIATARHHFVSLPHVGGSSHSWQMVITLDCSPGCERLKNIHAGVMEGVKILADRPNRDGSRWPVTDVDDAWPFVAAFFRTRNIHTQDRLTLPEVHFRYPFSWHDFRCDGRWRFSTVSNDPANCHSFCDPLQIRCIVHKCFSLTGS